MNIYIVNVWIENPVDKTDSTFSYYFDSYIDRGIRVEVDFNNRYLVGFVKESNLIDIPLFEYEENVGYKLKKINRIIDDKPLLNDELFKLGEWMSKNTFSPIISCYKAMLPSSLKPSIKRKKVTYVKYVRVIRNDNNLNDKLKESYEFIKNNKFILQSVVNKRYPRTLNKLIKEGIVEVFEMEKSGSYTFKEYESKGFLKLNKEQNNAYEEIKSSDNNIVLLHGVTGSGKTEIFLHLAKDVIDSGKQVLIMVPEISLTPMMIERVKERFQEDIAIYNSSLSEQEKYEQYKLVLENKIKVVVGTRSSCFMPFNKLGLIIMDEEHDLSYKQDNVPIYHARDILIKRSEYFNCKLILSSATPSLDSYARAVKKVYKLVELKNRINNIPLNIKLIDINKSIKKRRSYILSDELKEEINDRLHRKEQIILLLNRRGFNTVLTCSNCNTTLLCPHCDIALSYHKDISALKCHICNTVVNIPNVCPTCGMSRSFESFGFGTQRLEKEVIESFPEAKIIRLDSDSTTKKNSHMKLLEDFKNKKADILLGTQMISKGLDFENVTLVGILNGDAGLNRYDYRSQELCFDLLVQASGRSGRSSKAGLSLIQVYDSESFVIKAALKQDYIGFFKEEMRFRRLGQYPPYTYLISIIFMHNNDDIVGKDAYLYYNKFSNTDIIVLGPSKLIKIKDTNRYRIVLKSKNLEMMKKVLNEVYVNTKIRSKIKIDVSPLVLE